MPRALAAVLVGALLFAPRLASAQQPSDFFTVRFQAYLEALRRQAGIPGMSVAMVQDGAIVWEAGLGSQDLENAVPASPDTPYYVGDLTQTLSATLVLQCVENGTMTLDHQVPLPQADGTTVQATLRQLLSHTRPMTVSSSTAPRASRHSPALSPHASTIRSASVSSGASSIASR